MQRIARKDRGRLVEGDMHRGSPASRRVVVHGGQVVMHERIAMDAFERAGCVERARLLHPEQARGLDEQEGPEPLAAAERRIAHGLRQPAA